MNRERRKNLSKAVKLIDEAKEKLDEAHDIVESVKDEEERAYDNLPESIQDGDKGEAMYECVWDLEDVASELESIVSDVEDRRREIQTVIDR